MQPADLKAWKTIRQTVLSNDGKWFAYVIAPNEGDAAVVVRSTGADAKEMKFPIGAAAGAGGAGGGRGGAAGANSPLQISGDSRWVAFIEYPSTAAANGRGGRGGAAAGRGAAAGGAAGGAAAAPAQNKLALLDLTTGTKKEFDRVRSFAFNGDKPTYVAMQGYAPQPAPTPRTEGTDLVLYNLTGGEASNVGNVAEFGFDDSGEWLAYTIDARDQIGNGVQLRNMRTDVVRPIDSDHALYRHLAWADSGVALAVLRGRPDSVAHDTLYSVVSFNNLSLPSSKKTVFDPAQRTDFPVAMKVSVDRAPHLSSDLSTVFFGIREMKPMLNGRVMADMAPRSQSVIQAGAPGAGGTLNQPRVTESPDENPTLILWHGKDSRLQSQQLVQEAADLAYSYLAEYRMADNKFVRLSDDELRSVNLIGHDRYAYGADSREYDQNASYSGRRYEDVYTIDLKTGARKLVLKKHIPSAQVASPDGRSLLYWGEDAQWWVADVATGAKREISKGVPTVFADTSDDHNNLVTPPSAVVGWSKDGNAVLLSDGFDVWKVPTNGGGAVNLTGDGKKDQLRYQRLYAFDAPARAGAAGGRGGRGGAASDGIDLSRPLYFATYGEWTKQEGVSKVDVAKPGAQRLVLDDAKLTFQKAKDADVYVFTKQTAKEFPNYYLAGADLKPVRQLTDANPQQKDFAWTSGVKLINYTSAKGDKLQGALYLPANYEPGKKYPMLVTIYEKRSNLANSYVTPNETSTPNRSIYTSRGYAVFDPDIVYRVNDPGMSAVWCVIPAVHAAIASGMIDSSNVGLWGHSWGGYQTAFLVTQTNIFKSAIAGAPLTDMISMYSSIYWNSGGTDQAIFESSQGRFKGNYTDNLEAYIRNSPNFHAKDVKTPLIILSDDKDGAVDFNQGITYYNTLRQLNKDVILLEYAGENHGLARPINMKDYAMRQKDWFDHYLKGVPAPEWMTNGIPLIKMGEYWQQLKAQQVGGTIVP